MAVEIVRIFNDPSGNERVQIVRRIDGNYEYLCESWQEEEWTGEWFWVPLRTLSGIYGTEEIAINEAGLLIPWLRAGREG